MATSLVSSAKRDVYRDEHLGGSLILIKNKIGPKIDVCLIENIFQIDSFLIQQDKFIRVYSRWTFLSEYFKD